MPSDANGDGPQFDAPCECCIRTDVVTRLYVDGDDNAVNLCDRCYRTLVPDA